ncbi:MAG: tyrosine-type recombinase/integrase [Dehalococcoidia bacterium]
MWQSELDAFVQYLHAAGRAPTTIRLRRMHLERAFTWLDTPPFDVEEDRLTAYLAANDWKPESRKSVRASLRGFYTWAAKTGRVTKDPSLNLPQVAVPQAIPHPTPTEVVDSALATASRDQVLMLMLAAYAGLRRAEIAGLHSRNVEGDTLRVTGKGGKTREVPLHPRLVEGLRGREGFIFPGKDHGHLSPDWVGKQMKAVLGGGWTAHSLRHRFATRAYAGERDLLTVQQLLGHSSVATTQRYTQVPDDARRRAVLNVA